MSWDKSRSQTVGRRRRRKEEWMWKRTGLVVLFLLLGAALESGAEEAVVYVAVNGKDTNPGTLDRPLATLEKARNNVRAMIERGLKSDVLVLIREGTFHLLYYGATSYRAGMTAVGTELVLIHCLTFQVGDGGH